MVTETTQYSTVTEPWKGGPRMWRSAPTETVMPMSAQAKKQTLT